MHETKRNPTRIRTAAATCHRVTEQETWHPRSSSPNRRRRWFGGSLAGCLQMRWSKGTGKQASTPSALQALGKAASEVDWPAAKRSGRSWLSYSLVDAGACSRGNLSTLQGAISSLRSLAHLKWTELELPKTRTAGPRTQAGGSSMIMKDRIDMISSTGIMNNMRFTMYLNIFLSSPIVFY